MRGLIAQTQHIHAVLQCQLEGLSPSVVTGYSTHSQVVRKDHLAESELAALRGRPVGVQPGVEYMCCHHSGDRIVLDEPIERA